MIDYTIAGLGIIIGIIIGMITAISLIDPAGMAKAARKDFLREAQICDTKGFNFEECSEIYGWEVKE